MSTSDIDQLKKLGTNFDSSLSQSKADSRSVSWYPYQSMSNVEHLCQILPGKIVAQLVAGNMDWRVLDVGPADGDLGYFFESRGCHSSFLDNPPTNYNDCKGIVALRAELGSEAELIEQDIDREFALKGQYDFVIALGLLYHLRNPMSFLMTLAEHSGRMVLSTRVANHLPDGTDIGKSSVAYLLRCRESNNDPTNYWTFSPTGLETALKRCGWVVKTHTLLGSTMSNPVDNNADQRMFVYCERVSGWQGLGKHHEF